MSIKPKLKNALSALEDALRHIKRAKTQAPDIDELRRAKNEIQEAVDEVERAIRELPD
jgi:hypothetical protein